MPIARNKETSARCVLRHHTRAGCDRRRAGIVVVLALSGAALAPGSDASDFRIRFNDEPAALVTRAFESGVPDEALLSEIAATRGYQLLFTQLAAQSLPIRDPREVATEFRDALAGGSEELILSYGLQPVQARPARFRHGLDEFRRIAGRIEWMIAGRLNSVLPPNSDFRSTAHVIVGGRASGFAFTDRSDVAIRLDAFLSDSDDGPLDEGKLAALLCHELYHVGYRAAGGLPPRPDPPDSVWTRLATLYGPETVGEIWRATGSREWNAADVAARLEAWEPSGTWNHETFDRLLGFLARVQNEGCAVYADMPLRDDSGRGEPHGTEGWEEMVDDDFRSFERVVAALASGSSAAEIDALVSAGFAEDGPFYRVGYQMAERIDTRSGRRPFLATVSGGALEFFETYLETHPEGARKLDGATERELQLVIRQIRALGVLDLGG